MPMFVNKFIVKSFRGNPYFNPRNTIFMVDNIPTIHQHDFIIEKQNCGKNTKTISQFTEREKNQLESFNADLFIELISTCNLRQQTPQMQVHSSNIIIFQQYNPILIKRESMQLM